MGSRAVVIVCRDQETARKRFGVNDESGICYTRTGRRFFDNAALENELLNRVRAAIEATKLWDELKSDWFCFDCELLPWSAKAQGLLQSQYAAVGASARAALSASVAQLRVASERGVDVHALLERYQMRQEMAGRYVEAYRRYCWPVGSIDDLKLAPFHMLASEGAVHIDRDHVWHMRTLAKLCEADDTLLLATPFKVIDVTDTRSQDEGVRWWEELTGSGGEGIVVKPFDFVARGPRGWVQPGVKCRGREYLRIIYGAEYTARENIERLRARGLGHKRSLALREFSLGIEALERFVRREPLYRVHECVFVVLALESEPVDPRL
jgi:protein phosphatase